jgi:hypothetical protein
MRWENRRRDREQGVKMKAEDVPTEILKRGFEEPQFRYMY